MTYVSRDPFARIEIHKTRVRGASCAWCGGIDMLPGQERADRVDTRVYRFRVESDGGRISEDRQTFCSKGCRESYHG